NAHVASHGVLDPKTGALTLTAHLGRLEDGHMQLIDKGVPAVVYKVSEVKDLALLKLTERPPGIKKFPALRLAGKSPKPGSPCMVLGHPAAGLLWTIREGTVGAVGTWPDNMIDVVIRRLALPPKEGKLLLDRVRKSLKRKVVLSTCGLNP